jgi:hypothetical protein
LYDSGGPYWWRGLAEMQDEKVVCGWAKQLQEKTGAKRIIGVGRGRGATHRTNVVTELSP